MAKVPGVESVAVDFASKTAVVEAAGPGVAAAITKALAAGGMYHGTLQTEAAAPAQ